MSSGNQLFKKKEREERKEREKRERVQHASKAPQVPGSWVYIWTQVWLAPKPALAAPTTLLPRPRLSSTCKQAQSLKLKQSDRGGVEGAKISKNTGFRSNTSPGRRSRDCPDMGNASPLPPSRRVKKCKQLSLANTGKSQLCTKLKALLFHSKRRENGVQVDRPSSL